jgi:hypothetical protein
MSDCFPSVEVAAAILSRPGLDRRNLRRTLPRRSGSCPRHDRPQPEHGNSHPAKPTAGPHSITSSARSRKDFGMIRPSLRAVFRLMNSSNLVGCSTGKCRLGAPQYLVHKHRGSAVHVGLDGRIGH